MNAHSPLNTTAIPTAACGEHPIVVRHVLARWRAGMNTADIAFAAGMPEARCARILAEHQDRRHERRVIAEIIDCHPVLGGKPDLQRKERQVILTAKNAAKISAGNPEAIVLDMGDQIVWQNGVARSPTGTLRIAKRGGRRCTPKIWRFVVLMICGDSKLITHDDFCSCLWGDDPDGGPDFPVRQFHVLRSRAGELFGWVGLTVETRNCIGWMPKLSERQPPVKAG